MLFDLSSYCWSVISIMGMQCKILRSSNGMPLCYPQLQIHRSRSWNHPRPPGTNQCRKLQVI